MMRGPEHGKLMADTVSGGVGELAHTKVAGGLLPVTSKLRDG
jgi:hypothetical protein